MNKLRAFKKCSLSASSAEALAESFSVDPDAASSSAMLRQFGLTLIAWNYPDTYQSVICSLSEGDVLDVQLAKRLGFSPTLLAVHLLHQWGLSFEQCLSAGLGEELVEDEEEQVLESIGGLLSEICTIGERLARANQAEYYPNARDEWRIAQQEVERYLGPAGMEIIQERYYSNCEAYLTLVPHLFNPGNIIDPEFIDTGDQSNRIEERNPYYLNCDSDVREALEKLYQTIDKGGDSKEILQQFVREAIPSAKFSGGCVYTIDPGMMMLVPQLTMGQVELRSADAIDYSVARSELDLISVAYQTQEPNIEYRATVEGNILTAMAGMFGYSHRVGVLYLEFPNVVSDDPKSCHMKHFKALRSALNDCLGLG